MRWALEWVVWHIPTSWWRKSSSRSVHSSCGIKNVFVIALSCWDSTSFSQNYSSMISSLFDDRSVILNVRRMTHWWTKFSKVIPKKWLFPRNTRKTIFQNDECLFLRSQIFQNDLKITFSSKCWYFRGYEQKTIVSKWFQNNVICLEMLTFPIYG